MMLLKCFSVNCWLSLSGATTIFVIQSILTEKIPLAFCLSFSLCSSNSRGAFRGQALSWHAHTIYGHYYINLSCDLHVSHIFWSQDIALLV